MQFRQVGQTRFVVSGALLFGSAGRLQLSFELLPLQIDLFLGRRDGSLPCGDLCQSDGQFGPAPRERFPLVAEVTRPLIQLGASLIQVFACPLKFALLIGDSLPLKCEGRPVLFQLSATSREFRTSGREFCPLAFESTSGCLDVSPLGVELRLSAGKFIFPLFRFLLLLDERSPLGLQPLFACLELALALFQSSFRFRQLLLTGDERRLL